MIQCWVLLSVEWRGKISLDWSAGRMIVAFTVHSSRCMMMYFASISEGDMMMACWWLLFSIVYLLF